MKFASIDQIKKLQKTGMRQKDKEFWGGVDNFNIWYSWLSSVATYLEDRETKYKLTAPIDAKAPPDAELS
jgi:uncharacterized membrane protein